MQCLYNLLFRSVSYASDSQSVWNFFFLPDYFLIKTFLKSNMRQNMVIQRHEWFSYLAALNIWCFVCSADSEYRNNNT